MAKGTEPVDIKKEKEKFISLIEQESKRYNIQGMFSELNNKTD